MKRTIFTIVTAIGMSAAVSSCQDAAESKGAVKPENDSIASAPVQKPLREHLLTAAEQQALTPDMVIQSLKDGNKHYRDNTLTVNFDSAMVYNSSQGQYPSAAILSCIDSRVPVEIVFDQGLGDLFVARVAGNVVNDDILGSLEYSCKVSGAKLVLVLGHKYCGAVKAAIDDVKLGNITELLTKIKPAVAKSQDFAGDKISKNDDFLEYVAKNNVSDAIEAIKSKSPVLKEMADKGEIKIVGAYYNLKTGEVVFL